MVFNNLVNNLTDVSNLGAADHPFMVKKNEIIIFPLW
jgi:hypothetical protein